MGRITEERILEGLKKNGFKWSWASGVGKLKIWIVEGWIIELLLKFAKTDRQRNDEPRKTTFLAYVIIEKKYF